MIEEFTFEGNLKRNIVTHNLNMPKMRKEAREIDPNLTDDDLNGMFPFCT